VTRMLFIMHHIVLCTPCIALVNGGYFLHMRVDQADPKSGFQAEQVHWAFGGPQASSGKYINLALDQDKP
jgi:hypothetical protein